MNLIRRRHRIRFLLAWVCGRGDQEYGASLIDEAMELYRDRRQSRGFLYAGSRVVLDVGGLAIRRGPPRDATADLRDAARSLVRRPWAGLAGFVAMALGMGLTALTFVVVKGVLLDPLPYPESDRLVSIYTTFESDEGTGAQRMALSWPEFLDYSVGSQTVDPGAYLPAGINLGLSEGDSERMSGARMSASMFRVLGVAPLFGSPLHASHDEPGSACGVVLSERLWRSHFAADRAVLDRSVLIDGRSCQVTGVMPASFTFPNERTRLWVPFPVNRDPDDRGSHGVLSVARLRPSITNQAVHADHEALMTRWSQALPHHRGHTLRLSSYHEDVVGDIRLPLAIVGAAVVLVLVVMTANVSSLFLARGTARRRELAVRQALGASRSRVRRMLAWEALLVTVGGGVVGTAVVWAIGPGLVAAYPGSLPRASAIQFNVESALLLVGASIVIGLVVASVPAFKLSREIQADDLKSGGRAADEGRRSNLVLVTAEMALSVACTIAALLLVQSFLRLQAVPLGFDPDRVRVSTVSLPAGSPADEAAATRYFGELRERMLANPLMTEAGAMSAVPLISQPPPDFFTVEGERVPSPSEPGPVAHYVMATPGAIEAIGAQLIRGRSLLSTDRAADAPVALINEAAAQRYWGGRDPIGRRLRYPTDITDGQWSAWTPWITIVGVVRDIRSIAPAELPQPAIYVSYAQRPRAAYSGAVMTVVARGGGPSIREVARGVDRRAVATPDRELTAAVGSALARPRFMGGLMMGFSAIAFGIALVGLYALVSYGVSRRAKEIGLRFALGASRGQMLGLVARQLIVTLSIALPVGLLSGWWLARWMSALLFDVQAWEPLTYFSVAAGLTGCAIAATTAPLWRAMQVDPLIALRLE